MDFYYRSELVPEKPGSPVELPTLDLARSRDPRGYIPDEGLADAVNVALALRQPLLLTGEAGTGKTELAYNLAWQLGVDDPLVFETKSTSIARDLFYRYDNLAHFRAAQAGENVDKTRFLNFNALGLAILRANSAEEYSDILPSDFEHSGQTQSVVLIDEVDKAPRDFPNDILNELDRFYFRVTEFGGRKIEAPAEFRPVVVLTSNLEQSLPAPFLRRCVFYNIPFPDEKRLEKIVLSRVKGIANGLGDKTLLTDAISFFEHIRRQDAGMRKKPGTAEFLNWLTVLVGHGLDPGTSLRDRKQLEQAARKLSTLAKVSEDQSTVRELFGAWAYDQDSIGS